MSLKNRLNSDDPCKVCGFELWEPIATSVHGKLGLYNDDRFPGRCILAFPQHFDSLDSLPMDSVLGFLRDIQIAMKAIRRATGAERVNVSILGNRDPHLHAHLIPRFPALEEFPDCSPWNDRRPKGLIAASGVEKLKSEIFAQILELDRRGKKDEQLASLFDA